MKEKTEASDEDNPGHPCWQGGSRLRLRPVQAQICMAIVVQLVLVTTRLSDRACLATRITPEWSTLIGRDCRDRALIG